MKIVKFRDVEFEKQRIILHKKGGNLVIEKDEIDDILYVKPSIISYLLSGIAPGSSTYPGRLEIRTKVKIGKTKLHLVRIKFREVLTLPSWCLKIIDPANMLKWEK